jgi:RNA polymerase sigma-54 factor
MGQHMLLAPRMLQSIELLALPTVELDAFLQAEAEQNEALSVEEPPRSEPFERARVRVAQDATARHDEWIQSQPARGSGRTERLCEELALLELDSATEAWARWLVARLDARGYLPYDGDELLASAALDGLSGGASALELARAALAQLEPKGLGARDALDALRRQLDPNHPDFSLLQRILGEFLGELARNHNHEVARSRGHDLTRLSGLLAQLAALDPAPGAIDDEAPAPILRPDLVVERNDQGSFEVRLERSHWPSVSLDARVQRLANDRAQPREVRSYLRGKIERARWLVDALELRGTTLLAIARAVLAHQREYLEHGAGHLSPLTMTAIATELGLHTSTVSRAVAGKYVQTPWGVLALRELFPQPSVDGASARDDVREVVRELFLRENPSAPLSDDEAVAALAGRGLSLARRTVAKYRAELGIASSYLRRRYA